MYTSKSLELVVLRTLAAYAESVYAKAAKLLEILKVSRCWITLNRKFRALCNLKIAVKRINNTRYALDIKICGCSATNIDRIYFVLTATSAPVLHLKDEGIGIMLNNSLVIGHKGAKIAIIAFALAKRYMDVKSERHF